MMQLLGRFRLGESELHRFVCPSMPHMKISKTFRWFESSGGRICLQAGTSVPLAVLLAAVSAAAITYWVVHRAPAPLEGEGQAVEINLSDISRDVLKSLRGPVDLHFYALFSATNASPEQLALVQQIRQTMEEFEREADGRLRVSEVTEWSEASASQASAEGVRVQNLSQGNPFYLGIAVSQSDRHDALAQLSSAWLPALEFDLARAIARVASEPAPVRTGDEAAQAEAAVTAVNRLIPDPASVPFDAGRSLLRDASLKEFEAGVARMREEIAKIEQRLRAADSTGSDADRKAALDELHQVKARHEAALREVARRSQAQIEAWSRLKGQ